ncbi:hypothetical protein [Arthrobacter sp. A2-55]|uniref:hypothetical protein n=1 Tax=Arthrobacter sp. A2-55 TaxID=2897337 RepID=UPI0021CDB0B0|nr:hypothetical protein [Arthrobacter sp. A2-55]MCU6481284.1 hypothetical protein [Arthrobacter sp. A2-55]
MAPGGMSALQPYGLEKLNQARQNAARLRAEWMLLVHDGTVTLNDVLQEAQHQESKALLRLSVRQLLMSQPNWGRGKADSVIGHILSVLDVEIDRRLVTVGWLLDPRAGGRRFAAWLDAFEPKQRPPWPGFPHARSSHV